MKLQTSAFTGDPEMDKKLHEGEEATPQRRTAKIRFGIHVTDGGDGSVGVTLYSTEALAEKAGRPFLRISNRSSRRVAKPTWMVAPPRKP